MMESATGRKQAIYILTNEIMPGSIRIGHADDVGRHMKQLGESFPHPFKCFYAVEVEANLAAPIEKCLRRALEEDANPNQEYFRASPSAAKNILKIAELMGGRDVTPSGDAYTDTDYRGVGDGGRRRERFRFSMVGIEPGTVLHFKGNPDITCMVVDDTRIEFRGEVTSLSAAAKEVLYELDRVRGDYRPQGPDHWCYGSRTLDELRAEFEHLTGRIRAASSTSTYSNPNHRKAADRKGRHRQKPRFRFSMVDIEPGTTLYFSDDPAITCTVVSDTEIEFRGENTSLSDAATKIRQELGRGGYPVSGPWYWCHRGRTLYDLRKKKGL